MCKYLFLIFFHKNKVMLFILFIISELNLISRKHRIKSKTRIIKKWELKTEFNISE